MKGSDVMSHHSVEVARGERFEFGENWRRFLGTLDYRERGLTLTRLKCGGVGLGCNEFVFSKNP